MTLACLMLPPQVLASLGMELAGAKVALGSLLRENLPLVPAERVDEAHRRIVDTLQEALHSYVILVPTRDTHQIHS